MKLAVMSSMSPTAAGKRRQRPATRRIFPTAEIGLNGREMVVHRHIFNMNFVERVALNILGW